MQPFWLSSGMGHAKPELRATKEIDEWKATHKVT